MSLTEPAQDVAPVDVAHGNGDRDQRRRSGWLLLIVPLIATLAAGAWFGRSSLDNRTTAELASTGSNVQPASTPSAAPASLASSTPGVKATPAPDATTKLGSVNLGRVTGRYLLKGPAKAPAGSVVVFAMAGPKRAVHTDRTAPFGFAFDSQRIPNGTYTVTVTVKRPGLTTLVQSRQLEVANPAVVKKARKPAVTKKPSTGTASSSGLSAQAAAVLKLTNAQRTKAGCTPLTASSKLTTAAQAHTADMAKNNYFAHDSQDGTSPFTRIKNAGYNFRAAAENIAYGQADAKSVMSAWMNSPGHKANILNCTYTQIGIGYATRAGTPYWTQDFGTPL